MPNSIKEYFLSATDLNERHQRIIATVAVLKEHPLDIVILATKQALVFGKTDINAIKIFATSQASARIAKQVPLKEPCTPTEVIGWQPDLSIYDRLRVVTHGQ